jgi:hypothetical protein
MREGPMTESKPRLPRLHSEEGHWTSSVEAELDAVFGKRSLGSRASDAPLAPARREVGDGDWTPLLDGEAVRADMESVIAAEWEAPTPVSDEWDAMYTALALWREVDPDEAEGDPCLYQAALLPAFVRSMVGFSQDIISEDFLGSAAEIALAYLAQSPVTGVRNLIDGDLMGNEMWCAARAMDAMHPLVDLAVRARVALLLPKFQDAWPTSTPAVLKAHREVLAVTKGLTPAAVQRLAGDIDKALAQWCRERGLRRTVDLIHAAYTAGQSPSGRLLQRTMMYEAVSRIVIESVGTRPASIATGRPDAKAVRKGAAKAAAKEQKAQEVAVAAAQEEARGALERARALEEQVRALSTELAETRARVSRRISAEEREQRARAETPRVTSAPTTPPAPVAPVRPVTPPAIAATGASAVDGLDIAVDRLLAGHPVFLFTNQSRGGVRNKLYDALVALGADDPRVFETDKSALRGPSQFPPNSVVLVDTTFMGHTDSARIKARVKGSDVLFFEGTFGAAKLAQVVRGLPGLDAQRPVVETPPAVAGL